MTVTFLGTGTSQGIPIIACPCAVCRSVDEKDKRLRSSVMIEANGQVIVIDSGPDFRMQMLREKVKTIDALVFTHAHRDHAAGLDDIRAFNYVLQRPVDVFLNEQTEKEIRKQFDYIFSTPDYPGLPEINFHRIGNEPFFIGKTKFIPVEVMHYRMPVLGFRIHDFTYITDANRITDKELQKIRGTKYLVLNALRHEKHVSHFTLREAIGIVNQVKPFRAYFTHISHQLGKHETVSRSLPKGMMLAFDGLKIRC